MENRRTITSSWRTIQSHAGPCSEAFYNFAITPWMLVTPDIEVIGPSQKKRLTGLRTREPIGTATVLGLPWQIIL